MMAGPGAFVWYELMTTDQDAAIAFYGSVVGWSATDSGHPAMRYVIMGLGERPLVGTMNLRDEQLAAGARPYWSGYIGVEDVDAATSKALSLGANLHVGPTDIPQVGRFSVVNDPEGALITLFRGMGDAVELAKGTGAIGWHELATSNWPKAFDFYEAMFGWTKGDAISMGAEGVYQLFAHQGEVIGGMFNRPPQIPVANWLFYVNVHGIGLAIERVKAGGGQILNGPMQVPGGSWIVQCLDPQGAAFAMVSSKA